MQEKVITNSSIVADGYYRCWFRCSNCGAIFQHDMKNGSLNTTMSSICPNCNVKSGAAGVGTFSVIKFNPKYDEMQRHYFK